MIGQADDLGGGLVPWTMPTRAFDSVGDRLKERLRTHAPSEAERGIRDVELSAAILERDGFFARQLNGLHCIKWHNATPTTPTRQRDNSPQTGLGIKSALTQVNTTVAGL
jgi:hypothetical protein